MDTSRPLLHFTPPAHWMNDPNGLVYFDGEWHLFYQYVPATDHRKHWGHAVTADLLHWEHLPVALYPDGLGEIWSGSCVVDRHDTSGFFDGGSGLVAIFTHCAFPATGRTQSQSLAYSRDRGRTWTKFAGNPVLTSERRDFRDPKVFWHEPTAAWVMIVTAGDEVQLYRSADLKTWTCASSFGKGLAPGLVWECADLFPLRGDDGTEVWILLSSFLAGDNFQGKFGPCFAGYFAGSFDGHAFVDAHGGMRRVSHGPDDYAPVTFSGAPDGRTILMGWLNHWGYAGNIGTTPWEGQMTLPRELHWTDGALVQRLPASLDAARFWPNLDVRSGSEVRIDAVAWETTLPCTRGAWRLEAFKADLCVFSMGYDTGCGVYWLERHHGSLPPIKRAKDHLESFFASRYETALISSTDGAPVGTRVLVDACSVEAFGAGGRAVFCAQIFPPSGEWRVVYREGD